MYTIEADWITDAGLRAVVLMVDDVFRCGYVQLPHNHWLNGVGDNEHCPKLERQYQKALERPIGKRSMLSVLGSNNKITPAIVFDVHGSLTYSGGFNSYPVRSDNWWYGFDCNHWGDQPDHYDGAARRSLEYVKEECESLAQQIMEVTI